jgi:hypothetical protein
MKYWALALAVMTGCASAPKKAATVFAPPADTDAVLGLIGRIGGMAHACPIAADRFITAAHVIDPRPLDNSAPLVGLTYSDNRGSSGVLLPATASRAWDLGFGEPDPHFTKWYKIAEKAPEPGEKLWLRAWDFSSRDSAFDEPILEVTVLRVKAGYIIASEQIPAGTSGGCVLNAKSEVVGIVSFGMGVGPKLEQVAGIVSVYGDWLPLVLKDRTPVIELPLEAK